MLMVEIVCSEEVLVHSLLIILDPICCVDLLKGLAHCEYAEFAWPQVMIYSIWYVNWIFI